MDHLKFFSKAIIFVNELNKVFSDKYPNIRLYYKLMKKTPVGNTKAIEKHVQLLLEYININTEAIKNKSIKQLQNKNIIFTDKIFLNLTECLNNTDKETRNTMFTHLQLLLYISNPNDELKTILQKTSSSPSTKPEESKFIDDFIGKIESQFNEQEFKDPLSAAMNMMQSGLFSEIIQNMNDGVKSGSLNPQKLLGSVQGMLGDLTGGSVDINNILSGQMSNLEIPGGENGENVNIDMNQMFSMVGNLMGGLNGGGSNQGGNTNSNPMNMVSSLLPMLGGLSNSTPSIEELEEQMNKASLDDINKSLD
jgi:hypothetical protein